MASSSSFPSSFSPPTHSIGAAGFDNNGAQYNGKIIVISLAMLFFVLIFILALHIYAKWFWVAARRRAYLHASNSFAPNRSFRYTFNSLLYPQDTPVTGLDKATIDSLPTFLYCDAHAAPRLECAVCLSEFQENEKCRILPKCNHSFHIGCIDKWLSSHTTCPLCRANIGAGGDLSIELNAWTMNVGSIGGPRTQTSDTNVEHEGLRQMAREDSDVWPSLPSWRRSISERFLLAPRVGVQFPTNVLFWGDHGSMNSHNNTIPVPGHLHLDQGTSSPEREAAERAIPLRSSSFGALSGPYCGHHPDGQQHVPYRIPSSGSQLHALKRLLCREKKVFPTQQQQQQQQQQQEDREAGHGEGTSDASGS